MLTDVAALALALFAAWFGARPANPRKTYGYYRLEILAAFTNGISIGMISALIVYEDYQRQLAPPEVNAAVMMVVAAGGLAVN
ncbi:cation diffusion facilitator family transporter, partial [Acinetobacter baumannii]